MKLSPRQVLLICATTSFITWAAVRYNNPAPPQPDRPILSAIVKVARTLLWVAFFVEEPPKEERVTQQSFGSDDFPIVSHSRSL